MTPSDHEAQDPAGGSTADDPALERLRELARRIGDRAAGKRPQRPAEAPLMPPPVAGDAPPRPWSDADNDDEEA